MRRKAGVRVHTPPPTLVRSIFFGIIFLMGGLLGHLWASRCSGETWDALAVYLMDFCAVYDAGDMTVSLLSCLLQYFGSTVLVFVLGFSGLGAALLPLTSMWLGFSAVYTISCLVRAFGREGILLALAVLLLRLLFTLPCFFLLAGEAWPLSLEMLSLMLGQNKHGFSVSRRYVLLFVYCLLALAVGVCCERFLTPVFIRWALSVILPTSS